MNARCRSLSSASEMRARRPAGAFADSHRSSRCCDRNAASFGDEAEADLPPAGQFDIDLREQLRVEQRAVLDALAAIDAEAHAQGVEAVLRAGVLRARASVSVSTIRLMHTLAGRISRARS